MNRIIVDHDPRYVPLHPDQSVDGVWDRIKNDYGYGYEEATQDGLAEYAGDLASHENNSAVEVSPRLAANQKDLARAAFQRSYRKQDRHTGKGRQRPHVFSNFYDNADVPTYRNRSVKNGLAVDADQSYSDERTVGPNADDLDTEKIRGEYHEWLATTGREDTLANRSIFLYVEPIDAEAEEYEEISPDQDSNPDKDAFIMVKVNTRFGKRKIRVHPDQLYSKDEGIITPRMQYGMGHDLVSKMDGLRSNAALRATTERSYHGSFADDETPDWHDGFHITGRP